MQKDNPTILNKISIPEEALDILMVLNQNGYEAYVVGGCVRDCILGREPGDWDITTSARPEDIKKIFPKTIDTGIKHGTVTVFFENMSFEVTTYRIDGKYLDNRRPESIVFTTSLKDDLARRDFTMNAIAYHPDEGYMDPFNGIVDIQENCIRAVGNASERFKEDALRMLRAIRFSSQLNFTIHPNTFDGICNNSHLIENISSERIREELTKTLTSEFPKNFYLLHSTGLLKHILAELDICFKTAQQNAYHIYNVGMHSLTAVTSIDNDVHLRWTMLLHDIGKPNCKSTDHNGIDHFYGHPELSVQISKRVLKRLKFDNNTMDKVCRLIEHHDRIIAASPRAVRRTVKAVGDDIFYDLLKVKEADARAQNPSNLESRLRQINQVRKIYNDIKERNICLSLQTLAINGNDLISIGIKPGKELGLILNKLLDEVIENPELNTKEALLELARSVKQR